MLLKKVRKIKATLAFRLTFRYALLFSISALIAFVVIYLLIRAVVYEQTDHALLAEVKEFTMVQSAGGIDKLIEAMLWEAQSEGTDKIFLRIFSQDGRELATTDMSAWQGLPSGAHYVERLKKGGANQAFETLHIHNQNYPTRVISSLFGDGLIFQFGQSTQDDEIFLEILRDVFLPLMLGITLLSAIVGWFMAKNALGGVEEVTRTALEITEGDFGRRVAVQNRGAEIDLLAVVFNHMLDRINALFREMKEMNNNIAHDLRSPLARIRAAAEMALTTDLSADEGKAFAAGMIDDCDRLMGMINTMLDIAEAETGMADPKGEAVDIGDVIQNACELFMPVAESKGIKMVCEPANGCFIQADARMLQRMVGNLLDNALKYTQAGGRVDVWVQPGKEHVLVCVRDSGIGISEKDMPYIFDKFYRCDRSRSERGSGLGLSLVKAIVGIHHGAIDVASRPGEGSLFTVTLPSNIVP